MTPHVITRSFEQQDPIVMRSFSGHGEHSRPSSLAPRTEARRGRLGLAAAVCLGSGQHVLLAAAPQDTRLPSAESLFVRQSPNLSAASSCGARLARARATLPRSSWTFCAVWQR